MFRHLSARWKPCFGRKKSLKNLFVFPSMIISIYHHSLSVSLPQINLMKNENLFNVFGQIINANYLEKIINVVNG